MILKENLLYVIYYNLFKAFYGMYVLDLRFHFVPSAGPLEIREELWICLSRVSLGEAVYVFENFPRLRFRVIEYCNKAVCFPDTERIAAR